MKRLLTAAIAILFAVGIPAYGSTSAITATISDTDGTAWANATYTAIIHVPGQPNTRVTVGGVPVTSPCTQSSPCTASSSGVITGTFTDTSSVDQANARWVFTIKPNASVDPVSVSVAIIGATPNLTANFSAVKAPRFPASPSAYGYADIEVTNPALGNTYFNTASVCGGTSLRQYSNSGWSCGGSGGSSTSNLAGTALADYAFSDGSGTTLSDSSGNGNDATLIAGHLPTWVPNGLKFTAANPYQGVTLPAAVNNGQTFEILAYVDPLPSANGQSISDQYPLFINNTLGLTGLTLLYAGNFPGIYNLGINAGGGTTTATTQTFSGFHSFIFVLGTGAGNIDHIYIDGVELPYGVHGSSANKQTSGNLTISGSGVSPYNNSGLIGTMYRLRILSGQITSAQAASDSNALVSQEASRGVAVAPVQYLQNNPQLHAIGDSLTCAWNGTVCNTSYSWAAQLSLTNQPTYTITNWGVYGSLMQAMQAGEPNRVSPYCQTNLGPAIAINAGGTNDAQYRAVSAIGQTAAAFVAPLKRAGCDVFITSILSRVGSSVAPGNPTNDSQKNGYDGLVGAQWKAWGYKGFADVGANPVLGADGAYANATYFLPDGTHLTAAGELQWANAVSNTLNYYYSIYSDSNPHYITATTSLASADSSVSIGTLSGAVALTMPDCTGPTGSIYTISNPQAAQAVTVVGLNAAQPINGLTSAITIPNNSTVTLTDVANPRSTAGCHWSM